MKSRISVEMDEESRSSKNWTSSGSGKKKHSLCKKLKPRGIRLKRRIKTKKNRNLSWDSKYYEQMTKSDGTTDGTDDLDDNLQKIIRSNRWTISDPNHINPKLLKEFHEEELMKAIGKKSRRVRFGSVHTDEIEKEVEVEEEKMENETYEDEEMTDFQKKK